jgi:hypothetical protein
MNTALKQQTQSRAQRLRQLRARLTAEDAALARAIDCTVHHLEQGYWPVTEPEDVTAHTRLVEPLPPL